MQWLQWWSLSLLYLLLCHLFCQDILPHERVCSHGQVLSAVVVAEGVAEVEEAKMVFLVEVVVCEVFLLVEEVAVVEVLLEEEEVEGVEVSQEWLTKSLEEGEEEHKLLVEGEEEEAVEHRL